MTCGISFTKPNVKNVKWMLVYFPLTMLREGDVFSWCLCLYPRGRGGTHVTTTLNALDLTVQDLSPQPWLQLHPLDIRHLTPKAYPPPHIRHRTPTDPLLVTSGGHHWRPVQTCSAQLVATEARMVGKRVVQNPTGMLSCICIMSEFLDLQNGLNITSIWDQGCICYPGLPFRKRKLRFYNRFIALWMSWLSARSSFYFHFIFTWFSTYVHFADKITKGAFQISGYISASLSVTAKYRHS